MSDTLIQEMSEEEVDVTSGGIPLVLAGYLAFYGTKTLVAGVAGAAGFATIYYAAHDD